MNREWQWRQALFAVAAIAALLIGYSTVEAKRPPTPTPTRTPTGVPSATPTPTASPTATAVAASPTPTNTPVQPTATQSPTNTPNPTATPIAMAYGTLLSDSSKASQEYAAGVRYVEQEIGWDIYEPTNDAFSTSYRDQEIAKRDAFLAAGMQVVLGVGLQYPPGWAYDDFPNSRYKNQFGAETALNLTFNQSLRTQAEQYISRVNSDLGLNNYHAVRIGSGSFVEALFPSMDDGLGHDNSYWGWDANASGGSNRPPSIVSRPFAFWTPGSAGLSFEQVRDWYNWYLDAMVDGIKWQVGYYRSLGYTGYIHVPIPGLGARPFEYNSAIGANLDGAGDSNRVMGRAAVWDRVIDRLWNVDPKLVIHISSVADNSGVPEDNVTTPSDINVDFLNDPQVNSWSATRWIAYNANRFGLRKSGENPGYPFGDYGVQMMQDADLQAKAAGFYLFMWAHDANLYNGQGGVTLADYASIIAGVTPTPTPTTTSTPLPATPTPTAVLPTATPVPTSTSTPIPTATPPLPTPTPSGTGLHVLGSQILNASNQPLQLHGVNRSGYEYACSQGWGLGDGAYDAVEVAIMKTWNVNAVRVTLNESCWLNYGGINPAYAGANYQNEIIRYVNLLTSNGIPAIINLHWSSPSTFPSLEQEPMADRAHSPAFWSSVANTFKNNPNVLFEPYNEPHNVSWACWRDGGCTVQGSQSGEPTFIVAGMQEMVTAIRNTGATNIIVVTGNNWGSDLSGWNTYKPTDSLNQMAAGWHSYGDGLSCQTLSCWNTVLVAVLNAPNPILATEIGEFDCSHGYIDQVMNFLDSYGQGYQAWSWGPFSCSGDPALLTNWNGSPTQTYGQGFKDHLRGRP